MSENRKARPKISQGIIDEIMVLCKHKCCWCETNDSTEIHHINEDSSNNEKDNLFPCCPICQKKFHTSTPFARKITENQLKMRRDNFYDSQSNFKIVVLQALEEIKSSLIKNELIRKN